MDKYFEEYEADLRQAGLTDLEILDVIKEDLDNYIVNILVEREKIIEKIKNELYKVDN